MRLAGINNPGIKDWANMTATKFALAEEGVFLVKIPENEGFDQPAIDRAAEMFRAPAKVQTLVALDFRPMNILLAGTDPVRPSLTVIDWEMPKYGDPAADIGMSAAKVIVRENAGPDIATKEYVCKVALVSGAMWSMAMPCAIWDITTEEDGEI